MMRVVLAVVAAAALGSALVVPDAGKQNGNLWAVLVAGSNSWFNYRHQSDVCHAYQILHDHGVPDDHIIVMMYDDLAHNTDNPTPGVVINRPDGPNVYTGVPKDYVGKDVTPQNFLKVLKGDSEGLKGVGSGKVLGSGPNDRVFINLVDHGAPGIFGFPTSFLHVKDFRNAIQSMHRNKQFKDLVVYLEACESGSMFLNLPDDISVYALSAANATESSYACYFDKKRGTYLGDVFSIKWMEDTDREEVMNETLEKQFEIVKKETKTSHVLQWGERSLSKMKVGEFVGTKQSPPSTYGPFEDISDPCLESSVSAPDVPLSIFLSNKEDAADMIGLDFWTNQIKELKRNRTFVESRMVEIVKAMTGDEDLTAKMMSDNHHEIHDYNCHQQATNAWNDICFDLGLNPYAMRMVHTIVNLCEHGFPASKFTSTAQSVCTHHRITGIK